MSRDPGIIHRPEPITDACKLVREPPVIVRSDAARAMREARKILDTEPERDERASR